MSEADTTRRPAHRAVLLNEAILDSPTFRASIASTFDHVDGLEKWLNGWLSSTSKLVHDMLALEETINAWVFKSAADAIVENDYALVALKRVSEGQRQCWTQTLTSVKKLDSLIVDPTRNFLNGDVRNFKEARRALDRSQKAYDSTLARYVGHSKSKEASALREEAFLLWAARKTYLEASIEFCELSSQLRLNLDVLLIQVCCDLWDEMGQSRDTWNDATRYTREMARVRGWAKDMESSEGTLRRQLHAARKELADTALEELKPSRELDDYSTSTVPFLGSHGPVNVAQKRLLDKQGWLFLRVVTNKPVRYVWVRRWYYISGGVFGCLIPGPQGVLQGEQVGVLLCSAKLAMGEERRFCFEVKTKIHSTIFQAETQKELMEWLEAFEATKKRAFQTTMDDPSSLPGGADPAFTISPPSVPEFAAKAMDADEVGPGFERTATLTPNQDGRQSIEANGSGRRSFTSLGRDMAARDDSARIMHLHRKSNFGSVAEAGSSSSSAGGIASLISASHHLLPVNRTNVGSSRVVPVLDKPNSLAPCTLAYPPVMTNLSRTAVVVTAERSFRTLPTSIVANYWGSSDPPGRLEGDSTGVLISEGLPPTRGVEAQILPPNYPAELRAQNAQFRLLFPTAPNEKLVLVFRAAWSSSTERDSPIEEPAGHGRIYVTPEGVYFYSQDMGLVTAFRIDLDAVTEMTSAAGKDSDQILLHLGTNATGLNLIRIRVFLDDLDLLHTRLNLIIDNLQREQPLDTGGLISSLVNIKDEYDKPSPSADSWEEVSSTQLGEPAARKRGHRELGPQLRAPWTQQRTGPRLTPSQTVACDTEGMTMMAERNFEIPAKSCFHVLFGDKSFCFPKLYFDHRAQHISQGPWMLSDQGKMRRDYFFNVDYVDLLGRSKSAHVHDYQTIDVYSDHVTYVVTHRKMAWHLPHSSSFRVVSKIVITHVAKTKCKLAVYATVEWSKTPALSKNLVERQALQDAASLAEELAEMATDQVRKLGPRSRTGRAIQVYGHVGEQTQPVVFSPAATDTSKKEVIKPRTLTAMLLETVRSFAESAVSSIIMWAFDGLRKLWEVVSAQRLLLTLLGLSLLTNLLLTSAESSAWWKERRAAIFMQRVGVGPNPMMSKAIYLADLYEMTTTTTTTTTAAAAAADSGAAAANSTCLRAYRALVNATDLDAPWEEAGSTLSSSASQAMARRLRRTRQKMASYRYDLVVAMRVVNSIERETVRSELENWLVNENALCDDLDHAMRAESGRGEGRLGSLGRGSLAEWRERHCSSCRRDLEGLWKERRRMTMSDP
ncbi:hypothetical protein XA68_13403 [Ophiocordyceps unilateralis]|uniref:PH domain-containing protein n=1 Tax=Ophiocordyceps unilateralis TaxID=268505 RepID=A0A2A9PCK4_OPHUN|nr:hypothetical protein XA68_13403 [Ophiocordyceps unilateralis]